MFFTRFWIVVVLVFIATTFGDHIPIPAPVSQNVYWKAACRGAQLIGAMQNSEPQAKLFLLPTSSAWDGELRSELALWGYIETERDQMCDFDQFWHLAWPFDVYGLDARPKSRGGPNICHSAVHGNPWKRKLDGSFWPMGEQTYAVAGKTYRATGGFSTIGINPIAGMLFFIARKSPTRGAAELWNIPNPLLADLPAIRAQSDIAWGFWNRVMKGKNLGNIRAFWCIGVVSQQTNAIINQAHATFDRGDGRGVPGRTLVFPGVNFPIESVEAQAILGSENGLAVGYFLAQHKRQLGGNRMIYGISVFRTFPEDVLPNIVFWVGDIGRHMAGTAAPSPVKMERHSVDVVRNLTWTRRSSNGRNVIAEHIVYV